jgi:hypothetical protein
MENKQVTINKPFKTALLIGLGIGVAQLIFLGLLTVVGLIGLLTIGKLFGLAAGLN